MVWQEQLLRWQEAWAEKWRSREYVLSQCYISMQVHYPGPYNLRWEYDPQLDRMMLVPVFQDEKQQTMWLLRHSK